MIARRSLLLAGVALPVAARAQCVTGFSSVDACRGGVRMPPDVPGATLDLSFMVPGTLDPSITFTRASVGTYFDATGTMQTAAVNTPRWDYNPTTHVLNGLLIEEARTNVLLNSATLTTQSVAVTAQIYALSFYGTGTVTLSGASTAGPLTGTGASNRVSQVFTPTAGSLTLTVTGTVTNAQLEATTSTLGGYPSSYIPTAGAAVARALEVASMPVGAWYNAAQGSVAGEYMVSTVPNPSNKNNDLCGFSDNTSSNRMILRGQGSAGSNVAVIVTSVAGTLVTSPAVGNNVANVPSKLGAAWNGATVIASMNGGATISANTGIPAPGVITTLMFGDDMPSVTNTYLNGWIRRLRYWPRALGASELQSVTA